MAKRDKQSPDKTVGHFDPSLTPNDRVAAYFESITGRPMTREEKIPLGVVIHGDAEGDWKF